MNAETTVTKKMGERIASWVWNCFDALGMTTAILAFINLDGIEKAIVFLTSMTFLFYRVYHLHLDAKKKSLDIEEKKFDLKEKQKPKPLL